jgi:hypothetical protein
METRSTANNDKETDKNYFIAELLKKTDTTNKLLQELIDVLKHFQNTERDLQCTSVDTSEIIEETSLKTIETEVSSYHSPTLLIQREINELVLKKETYKIKQKIRSEWNRTLNYRKQPYWQQINNANHAEYFEKWINQENPIIPRKFRIKEIRGEPEVQTAIRVDVAINRVKGEIELLRMRAENNQRKVLRLDDEMEEILKTNANGLVLESLQKQWKSDCQKEEDRSYNRWRYTESWLLDYARKYGNDGMKQQLQRATKTPKQNSSVRKQASRASYASVLNNDNQPLQQQLSKPTSNKYRSEFQQIHYDQSNYYSTFNRPHAYSRRTNNGPRKHQTNNLRTNNQVQFNQQNVRRYRPSNIYRNERTTFIGRGVRHHFLGGGKPKLGQRYIPQFHQQTVQI